MTTIEKIKAENYILGELDNKLKRKSIYINYLKEQLQQAEDEKNFMLFEIDFHKDNIQNLQKKTKKKTRR